MSVGISHSRKRLPLLRDGDGCARNRLPSRFHKPALGKACAKTGQQKEKNAQRPVHASVVADLRTKVAAGISVNNSEFASLKRMAIDLEKTRVDVEAYLQEKGIPVFFGYDQMTESMIHVSWDTEKHPDFRDFVGTAATAGVKLMVFHSESFSESSIDEALDQLEICDFSREEKKNYEKRLKALQGYEGFTSLISLSFTLDGRVYQFELHSDWHDTLEDIWMELDAASGELPDDSPGDGSVSGYFSNN